MRSIALDCPTRTPEPSLMAAWIETGSAGEANSTKNTKGPKFPSGLSWDSRSELTTGF